MFEAEPDILREIHRAGSQSQGSERGMYPKGPENSAPEDQADERVSLKEAKIFLEELFLCVNSENTYQKAKVFLDVRSRFQDPQELRELDSMVEDLFTRLLLSGEGGLAIDLLSREFQSIVEIRSDILRRRIAGILG